MKGNSPLDGGRARRAARVVPTATLLLADAVAFVALLYKAIELVLLGFEGVLPRNPSFAGAAGCVIALLVGFAVQRRARWVVSRERALDQVLGIAVPLALVLGLFTGSAHKGFSGAWIPIEWHKLPANVWLMTRVSPRESLAGGVALLALACAFASSSRPVRVAGYALLVAWAELSTARAAAMPSLHKVGGYLLAFASPPLLALTFSVLGFQRWAMRAALAGACGTLVFWHYVGLLPLKGARPLALNPGFTKLYPAAGSDPDFPLEYMRELVLSEDGRFLFTCFGPSSGIVRIDLATGQAHIIGVHGLSRYLWRDAERDELVTVDWDSGDFLTFSGDPFERTRLVNLLQGPRIAPWAFAVTPERVYVTFHEHPILAEYERSSVSLVRQLDFKEQGLTRFNAGLLGLRYDGTSNALYAELGMTDARDQFLLVKVDPKTLTVAEQAVLPEGGLDFVVIPEKQRLIAASFFSNRWYEFALAPLRQVRVIEGPLNSRNLVWDARRDVLLGLAFLPGELLAIDYATGTVRARVDLGNKAQSLLLDGACDRLLVGSDRGIFAIDLATWLGPVADSPSCAPLATPPPPPPNPGSLDSDEGLGLGCNRPHSADPLR